MNTKISCLTGILLFYSVLLHAFPPGTITKHIKIDQFGYLPNSKKFAVEPVKTTLSLYPNPVKDKIIVAGYAATNDQLIIQITDASGKQVYSERWKAAAGSYSKPISIESLAPGIYSLSITSKLDRQQAQFYKQ